MYEVGHRLPAASLTLEEAQQEERRNREVYEMLEEHWRNGTLGASPKVVERQWLRVHVDLSLADSLDETPLARSASLSASHQGKFLLQACLQMLSLGHPTAGLSYSGRTH